MIEEFSVSTSAKTEFIDITAKVKDFLRRAVARFADASGLKEEEVEGACHVFCHHTTGAITINENTDPDVLHDLEIGLNKAFPDLPEYRHIEGNSAAHIKSSCIGTSETVIVKGGKLLLGTWQGIYFCEFDGPRRRHFAVQVELHKDSLQAAF